MLTNTLCVRAPCSVRLPPQTMAGYHHGTNGLFGAIVCRLQSRVEEKSENRIPLCAQSSGLPPRLVRMSLRRTPREGGCLALAGALRLFQGAQQLLHPTLQFFCLALQSFLGRPQLCHFLPKTRIFFNQLPHVPKLLAPWRKTSAALEAASRR